MIARAHAVALGAVLAAIHGATVRTWDDPVIAVGLAAFDALGAVVPGAAPVIEAIRSRGERVSITIATPIGTQIILSPAAVETPESYAETVCHELVHASQIERAGGAQTMVDYLGSGELRAQREADAYACGLWLRYLLTGEVPSIDSAMTSLDGGLYHLADGESALARGVVTSHVQTMREGLCPPILVAQQALEWLQQNAREAIVPLVHRARS